MTMISKIFLKDNSYPRLVFPQKSVSSNMEQNSLFKKEKSKWTKLIQTKPNKRELFNDAMQRISWILSPGKEEFHII